MSLIIDALEKVQKQTPEGISTAEWLVVDRPIKSTPTIVEIQDETASDPAISRGSKAVLWPVGIFVLMLVFFGVIGFKILSSDFTVTSLTALTPQMPLITPEPKQPEVPLVLRGVLQDPGGSFCILGEQILKVGDTWRGFTVTSIEARHVVVRDIQNRLLTLQLQES